MSDPESNRQGKGFKGLQSLGAKSPEPPAIAEHKADTSALPSEREAEAKQVAQPQLQPIQSQTAAPPWRGWVIGLGILGAIVLFIGWAGNPSSPGSSYSEQSSTDYSSTASEPPPAESRPGPAISIPPVGNGLVLSRDQIRYCVYEGRRIKGAEKVVDNYDQTSVSTFNAMVEDYNSRCSHFQYHQGALTPIETEADQIQAQLEREGRERMTDGGEAAADAAQAAADAAAAAADAAASASASVWSNDRGGRNPSNDYSDAAAAAADAAAAAADAGATAADAADAAADSAEEASDESEARGYPASIDPENLRVCLSGNYPSLCKRSLLTESQMIQVAAAERRENLRTCLSGNYPSLCNHSLLSHSERIRVADAERSENLRTCMSGSYPSLCKQSLLSDSERRQVDHSEKRENLRTCLTGNYPSLCKRSMLTEGERTQVEEAERRENLRICLSGHYPSLCNRSLLTETERSRVARAESRP